MRKRAEKHKFIKALLFWEKIFLFLIALGVVAFMSLALGQWSEEFKNLFLYMDDLQSWLYLTIFIFAVTFVLRWLLIWVWRLEFKEEIKLAKRRRRRG